MSIVTEPGLHKTLTCSDCAATFVFTAGQQVFFAEHGFSKPRRCLSCRRERKIRRLAADDAAAGAPPSAPRW